MDDALSRASGSVYAAVSKQLRNDLDEPAGVDRLGQVNLKAGGTCLVSVFLPGISGQRDRGRHDSRRCGSERISE